MDLILARTRTFSDAQSVGVPWLRLSDEICVQVTFVCLRVSAELGKCLAAKKMGLVFGGFKHGLMGLTAKGAMEGGGHVIGVTIPRFRGGYLLKIFLRAGDLLQIYHVIGVTSPRFRGEFLLKISRMGDLLQIPTAVTSATCSGTKYKSLIIDEQTGEMYYCQVL